MYIHVMGIDFYSLSTISLLDFRTVPEVPYFWFFILYLICHLILVSLHAHVLIFSDVRFSYLALVQDQKITCVLPANTCCTVYVNCLL
jgi:hypothetical protein